MSSLADEIKGRLLIVSCEGAAEEVAIRLLLDAKRLLFSEDDLVAITRKRSAKSIQEEYLNYEYDRDVCIVRVHDSKKENFKLGRLYAGRFTVIDIYTQPEIEALVIAREGEWEKWRRSKKKPSDYCIQDLGLAHLKEREFLENYWDVASLERAARDYKRLRAVKGNEYCIADMLAG